MEIKKSTALWIVIGIMFVLTLYVTFKVGSIETIPVTAEAIKTSVSASSGMVGGC